MGPFVILGKGDVEDAIAAIHALLRELLPAVERVDPVLAAEIRKTLESNDDALRKN